MIRDLLISAGVLVGLVGCYLAVQHPVFLQNTIPLLLGLNLLFTLSIFGVIPRNPQLLASR
jgi:hypothetical protein